ncbi:MAG: transposase, partial [Pseudomonadota bacterium]
CLKGIDTVSALTLVVEAQEFKRFGKARSFMGYTGLVVSEFTSSFNPRRGSITKAGNAHIRRILVEAAWSYARRNVLGGVVNKRREGCPAEVVQIAKKAQNRLHRKFSKMVSRGKPHQVAVVAVARELAGFVWSIAQRFPTAATN